MPGACLNVSVMGGFAYADTPFNGLTVVVTATDQAAADALAKEIAEAGWERRDRFRPGLTSLDEAVRLRKATAATPLIFADVADNPGGGGRGNTMAILQAFHAAASSNALVGVIHDPALAAEAHDDGRRRPVFEARFNRDGGDEFSKPFAAPAVVAALLDQPIRGRRGIYANNTLDIGKVRRADAGRHHRRRPHPPLPVRRSDVLRGVRPGHRRRPGRGGEIARPFPRRLRRILPTRSGHRGRCARPDQPDPVALSLAAYAAARAADRRRRAVGRRPHEARRSADPLPGARPGNPGAQHPRHGRGPRAPACRCART